MMTVVVLIVAVLVICVVSALDHVAQYLKEREKD